MGWLELAPLAVDGVDRLLGHVILLVLMAGAAINLLPFLWTLSTSLKEATAVFDYPPKWIPEPVVWREVGHLPVVPTDPIRHRPVGRHE